MIHRAGNASVNLQAMRHVVRQFAMGLMQTWQKLRTFKGLFNYKNLIAKALRRAPLFFITMFFLSCNAFKHGYTWNKAQNSYYLVTGDKGNFGDKRLQYNKHFHKNSALSNFLDCNCNGRGMPGFLYEYLSDTKCRGIKLFYPELDSAFIFEEPKKGKLNSVLKQARKMDEYERQTFERLKTVK